MTDSIAEVTSESSDASDEWTSLRDRVYRGTGNLDLLLFRAGSELFALPLAIIREALDGADLFDLPDMPPHVSKMLSVDGSSLPIYDSRVLLGARVADASGHPSVLIIKGSRNDAGLAVDALVSTVAIDVAGIRKVPALEDASGAFVGVFFHDGQLFTLLDTTTFMQQGGEQ